MSIFHKMFMATSGVSVVTPPPSELADPYFNNVELLLHGDGTNGSTTITDSSPDTKTITVSSNAQIDTAIKKFGTGSIQFDGTGDQLSFTNTGFGTGDFTYEAWIYPNAQVQAFPAFFVVVDDASSSNRITAQYDINGQANKFRLNVGGTSIYSGTKSTGQWYHVAVVRSGTTVTFYLDGASLGTATYSYNVPSHTGYIGGNTGRNSVLSFKGYIDDLRITNGVARYTADFNPPSAAHPDIGSDQYFYATELLIPANGASGSTTFTDDSSSSRTITASGNAQIDTAIKKFGSGSAEFDGNGDYLIAGTGTPSYPNFGTGPFTIEMWIYNTTSGLQGLWTTHRVGTSGGMYFYIDTNNRLNHGSSGNGDNGSNPTSNNVISLNTWHHVALCREGTGTNQTRIFVDGTVVSSHTDTSNYQTYTYGPYLGAFDEGGNDPYYYTGYIDDVRISNVARYTSDFTPPRIEHPDFGATREAVSITANGNAQISTAQSKFGGSSAYFDGTGDRLESPSLADLSGGPWTIEGWYYFGADPNSATKLLWSLNDQGTLGYAQLQTVSGTTTLRLQQRGGSYLSNGTFNFNINTWYHIATVWDGTNMKVYVNGTAALSSTTNVIQNAGNGLTINGDGGGSLTFAGYIDEFRISTTARYTSNFTVPTSAFNNDSNTSLLLHMDNPNSSTTFIDDNGLLTSTE